jgi:RNA polymerase sigma-70 factor (ECF subfamily)
MECGNVEAIRVFLNVESMKLKASLIEACKNNTRTAQSEVYRLCYSEAIKVAMRYTRNNDEALEVINSSFLKAFMHINDFKGDESNIFGWLKRIIINKALDHLRSNEKYSRNVDIELAIAEVSEDDFSSHYETIISLIQKLPSRTATVFNLFAIEGYSHKEIAEMLNITESNSKYHLHAARKSLQEWLFKTEKYER